MPPNDPARPAAARRRLGRGPGVSAAPARADGDQDQSPSAPSHGPGEGPRPPEPAEARAAMAATAGGPGVRTGVVPAEAVGEVGDQPSAGAGGGAPVPGRGGAGEDSAGRAAGPEGGPCGPGAAPDRAAAPEPVQAAAPDRAAAPEPVQAAAPDPAAAPEPVQAAESEPAQGDLPAPRDGKFTLRLANFEGPFDLLLQLISRHKLDVTEVALSRVTDEFMAHIRAMGPDWDLDQTTEFLVVAATLLDLKAARLLPVAEVEDEADLALLEARDLLFARLLQYRAYKQVAGIFEQRAEAEGRRYPRTVGLEPHHAELLPEVVISIGAEGFARLAAKAMQPRPEPQVYVDHIHAPLVSVREQAEVVVRMLRARGEASFAELTEDAPDTLTVVARFLALLELYREKAVELEQEEALQALTVRWSGGEAGASPAVTDEFDRVVAVEETE
ncbi:segregation and condensation protein A [Streptomyces sp. NPDC048603]|uniref:segregation and condensation protein A n=1 Tax=Streptomyces sp. NPDC048603 TaxID=3365577 RepID=UPI0037149CE8